MAKKITKAVPKLIDDLPRIESCKEVSEAVNKTLRKRCKEKYNKLKKCNDCKIEDKNLLVLDSPFDAHLLNTGLDPSGTVISSGSGSDSHWEVGLGTTTAPPTSWIPAFVFRSTAWLSSPYSNANWISLYNDSDHSGNIDVYFRIRFYLNSNIDPALFSINMDFYADNAVHQIYVNGTSQGLPAIASPYGHVGFKNGKETHAILDKGWKKCLNEIVVHVKSGARKIGFLAQNASQCYLAELPKIKPSINIKWGDSQCDCIETNDFEVFCITVCNPFSNVSFNNFKIGRISICDENGNPVDLLPDGTPSVEIFPMGPYCFGDIGPCSTDSNKGSNCVSREFVLRSRGAKGGKYKLKVDGVCFSIEQASAKPECFELMLCKD